MRNEQDSLRLVRCLHCPAMFLKVSWLPWRAAGFCCKVCQLESGKPPVPFPVTAGMRGGTYQDRYGRKMGEKLIESDDDDSPADA